MGVHWALLWLRSGCYAFLCKGPARAGDEWSLDPRHLCPCLLPLYSREHSIENQLPFLQHICRGSPARGHPGGSLSFAPVCVGWLGSTQRAQQLGGQILAALRQAQAQHPEQAPPLLIATSDFTHAVSL